MKRIFILTILCFFLIHNSVILHSQNQDQIKGLADVFAKAIMKVVEQLITNLNEHYLNTYSTESFKRLTLNNAKRVNLSCKVSSWPPVNDSCMSDLLSDEDLVDGTLESNDILEMQLGYNDENLYFKLKTEGLIPGDMGDGSVNFLGFTMIKKDNNVTDKFFILFSPNYYSIFKMPAANLFRLSGNKIEPVNSNLEHYIDGNALYLKLPQNSIGIKSKNKLYIIMASALGGESFLLKDYTQTILYEF